MMEPDGATLDWRASRGWVDYSQSAPQAGLESTENRSREATAWPLPFHPAPTISDSPGEKNEGDPEMQDWARVAGASMRRWMEEDRP